jgi:glutamate/tyrosine decarboxylase-like PLP-dependent enzyme
LKAKRQTKENETLEIKSFFLGPQAENAPWVNDLVKSIMRHWFDRRRSLFGEDPITISKGDQRRTQFRQKIALIRASVEELTARFEKEVPAFSPRYIGHMSSEISIPALLGHIVTLLHNPNNISEEVSRVGLQIEREAISALMEMVGFDARFGKGHFTSGGTVANIEGLVRARYRLARWLALGAAEHASGIAKPKLFETAHRGWESYEKQLPKLPAELLEEKNFLYENPYAISREYEKLFGVDYNGPVVLVTDSKHYSWPKAVLLLGLGKEAFWSVELDKFGKLSVADLKRKVEKARQEHRPIAAVVTVAGTTELGDFDPIDEVHEYIAELRHREGIHLWHHVDAAYGGFFCSLPRGEQSPVSENVQRAIHSIREANSLTIDPHKLGYVPYSCGAFLVGHGKEYYVAPFDAPYIRFDQQSQSGPQTLDGSRSAGGACATWLTAKSIGFGPEGYGVILKRSIAARKRLEGLLAKAHPWIRIAPHSETDIVCFSLAAEGELLSRANERADTIYERFSPAQSKDFFVSKTALKWPAYSEYLDGFLASWKGVRNTDVVTLVRMCLMNPFFDLPSEKPSYAERFVEILVQEIDALTHERDVK